MGSKKVKSVEMLHGAEPGNEQFKAYFEDGSEEIFQTWDYANIYSHPHLYEILFCDTLKLGAYKNLGILLARNVDADETKLSVLDVACGSGLMGKFLIKETALNIDHLVGVDIAPEAIAALNRDCPGVYSEAMTVDEFYNRQEQHKSHFNCLAVSGGAYKIGEIGCKKYIDLLDNDSYILFNLAMDENDEGRRNMLKLMDNEAKLISKTQYFHRQLAGGKKVYHEAFLYKK